jgi:SAM-dependent methyltransferase
MATADTSSNNFLEAIRLAELERIESILGTTVSAGARILEVGAGTGWQARELSARGYQVSAIDIPTSNHGKARIWPITDFDGRHIPFPDRSFDIVYSSNVLEHVEDVEALNEEIARLLKDDGTAIHYVPTTAGRAWSIVAFLPALLRDVYRRLRASAASPLGSATPTTADDPPIAPRPATTRDRALVAKVARRLTPHVHGSEGTWFGELWRFRKATWDRFFAHLGWMTVFHATNGLFLTGDMILGARLPVERRKRLSRALGSSANLYVLKRSRRQ